MSLYVTLYVSLYVPNARYLATALSSTLSVSRRALEDQYGQRTPFGGVGTGGGEGVLLKEFVSSVSMASVKVVHESLKVVRKSRRAGEAFRVSASIAVGCVCVCVCVCVCLCVCVCVHFVCGHHVFGIATCV